MRKLLVFTALLLAAKFSYGQQLAQYSNYMLNQFVLNPAAVPQSACVEVKAGYRSQWVGFEGAPTTQFGSFCMFIPNKKKGYRKGKHAVGAYLENDETPPSRRQTAYFSYSYHKQITRELWGAVGVHAGIMQYQLDFSSLHLYDGVDNAISNGSAILYPDLNPGIWLYSKNLYAGLSIKNAVGNKLTDVFGYDNRLRQHFYLTYGYRILSITRRHSFIPSINVKFVPLAPVAVDLNAMYDYRNKFAIGLSYRNRDAVCALVRLGLGKVFSVGYAFDFTTSKVRVASSNSHEIILGIKLCKGKEEHVDSEICPAYR